MDVVSEQECREQITNHINNTLTSRHSIANRVVASSGFLWERFSINGLARFWLVVVFYPQICCVG